MQSDHPLNAYFLSLGMFIQAFAEVESLLLRSLADHAGVSHLAAKAVFSGVRIDTAKSQVQRLREIKGLPENPHLKRAFAQLTAITTTRNDIVHYGVQFHGEWGPRGSNELAAMPGKERKFSASPRVLGAMTSDLQIIKSIIIDVLLEDEPVSDELAQWPWRYKPETQAPARPQRPDNSPKHSGPREPSHG